MRSGISYFNSALYRKTMGRFWPLWALYGLGWMFALPLNLLNQFVSVVGSRRWNYGPADPDQWLLESAKSIPNWLQSGVWFSCLFGLLCAMAVFGYLYNSRSACAIHALPLRREGLFTTQYLAGLSFALLPHLVVALCTAAVEMALFSPDRWTQVLPPLGIWLLVQSGTSLFFFSFASFCAMFTGHILALPIFYTILNGLCGGVYGLVTLLLSQFFYGYSRSASSLVVDLLTPLYSLGNACRWELVVDPETGLSIGGVYHLASPATVAGYVAAGLVLALLALLVYRRRQVESAGDVVSVPLVRPLFQWGMTFCVGLSFGMATALFFSWSEDAAFLSVCVVLWSLAGFFAAEMLLKKSFRVLRAWKRALAAFAIMSLLCLACFTDVMGIETRVPDPEQVTALSVHMGMGAPYDEGRSLDLEFTRPEDIAPFLALHQAIVEERARNQYDSPTYDPGDNYFSLSLYYTLDGNRSFTRQYYSVPIFQEETETEGTVSNLYCRLAEDRDMARLAYGLDTYAQGRLVEAYLNPVRLLPLLSGREDVQQDYYFLEGATPQQLEQLWQAVQEDFAQGRIGLRYPFENQERWEGTYITDLGFSFELPDQSGDTYYREFTITLTPSASSTLAWLEQYGSLGEQYQLIPHSDSTQAIPDTEQAEPTGQAIPLP